VTPLSPHSVGLLCWKATELRNTGAVRRCKHKLNPLPPLVVASCHISNQTLCHVPTPTSLCSSHAQLTSTSSPGHLLLPALDTCPPGCSRNQALGALPHIKVTPMYAYLSICCNSSCHMSFLNLAHHSALQCIFSIPPPDH
jgi:hypothetical protein